MDYFDRGEHVIADEIAFSVLTGWATRQAEVEARLKELTGIDEPTSGLLLLDESAREILELLLDLDEEALFNIYDLDPRNDAPLDMAVYAWRQHNGITEEEEEQEDNGN
jgi:hypothetical protein